MSLANIDEQKQEAIIAQKNYDAEVELIKKKLMPDAPDIELRFFLTYCKKVGLDPIKGDIVAIPRKTKNKKTGKYEIKYTIQFTRDGLLSNAQSDPNYLGMQSAVVFSGDDCEIDQANSKVNKHIIKNEKRGDLVGAWAIVRTYNTVLKMERTPYLQYCDLNNYMPLGAKEEPDKDNEYDEFFMWRKDPLKMILKEAERLALKKARGIKEPDDDVPILTNEFPIEKTDNPVVINEDQSLQYDTIPKLENQNKKLTEKEEKETKELESSIEKEVEEKNKKKQDLKVPSSSIKINIPLDLSKISSKVEKKEDPKIEKKNEEPTKEQKPEVRMSGINLDTLVMPKGIKVSEIKTEKKEDIKSDINVNDVPKINEKNEEKDDKPKRQKKKKTEKPDNTTPIETTSTNPVNNLPKEVNDFLNNIGNIKPEENKKEESKKEETKTEDKNAVVSNSIFEENETLNPEEICEIESELQSKDTTKLKWEDVSKPLDNNALQILMGKDNFGSYTEFEMQEKDVPLNVLFAISKKSIEESGLKVDFKKNVIETFNENLEIKSKDYPMTNLLIDVIENLHETCHIQVEIPYFKQYCERMRGIFTSIFSTFTQIPINEVKSGNIKQYFSAFPENQLDWIMKIAQTRIIYP